MSIWHLVWIVPLSSVIGFVFSRICTAIDLERSIENGEPFEVWNVVIQFEDAKRIDDGED